MKPQQISAHVWRLGTWLGIRINVWLVVDEEGVTLVDAGLGLMSRGILRAVERLGAGPLQRIVLTHGHSDHTGAVAPLLKALAVPVYAHAIEIPYMEGRVAYPRRSKSATTVAPGVAHELPLGAAGELRPIAGLTPYLTPGHSPGHVVYHHEADDVLLAGDLFTSRNGKLRKPMAIFTGDMQQALESGQIVGRLKPQRLEVCHGGSVVEPARQLDALVLTQYAQGMPT